MGFERFGWFGFRFGLFSLFFLSHIAISAISSRIFMLWKIKLVDLMSRLQLNSEDLLLVDDLVLGWVWFFRYNYLSNFKSDFYAVKNKLVYLMSRLQLDLVDMF